MNPSASAADSEAPMITATIQARTVSAVSAIVAVRGIAFIRSDEFDLLDLVIAVAGRRRDFDLVALLAPDQRSAERRIVADPPVLGVGFGLADELVFHRLAVLVGQSDRRAEADLVPGRGRRIDYHRAAQAVLEIGDRRLDVALPLFRRVIFGILREIAV